jgi:hypothetical protein
MKKVAKLIYVSFMTRVVVPEDATEEDILRAAKPKFIQKVNEELSENLEEILDDEECPAEDDEPITGGAVLIPVKDRGQDYWETLSPDCDDAIEIVARQLESGDIKPKDFFRKIREGASDLHLYKALVIIKEENEVELIHDEVIDSHPVNF